jgi:hypothetical protein
MGGRCYQLELNALRRDCGTNLAVCQRDLELFDKVQSKTSD